MPTNSVRHGTKTKRRSYGETHFIDTWSASEIAFNLTVVMRAIPQRLLPNWWGCFPVFLAQAGECEVLTEASAVEDRLGISPGREAVPLAMRSEPGPGRVRLWSRGRGSRTSRRGATVNMLVVDWL